MSSFLEQYGKALFTLVLVAILIAFADPLGMNIKNATTDKVCQTEQIGCDEISAEVGKTDDSATGGSVRPAEPAEAVDQVYCIFYDDGEMTISQNEIEPDVDRTVVRKKFCCRPYECTHEMTTVRFVGAVKPKSCDNWFNCCMNIVQFKNFENLYLPSNICGMFAYCKSLTSLDLSNFDTSKVTNMSSLFFACESLTSINFDDNFDTSNVTIMNSMFFECESLTSLDLSNFDTSKVTNMIQMFGNCRSLTRIEFGNKFDTCNVTKMDYMFAYCKSLTSLDLSSFDTSKLISRTNMFIHCFSLKDKSVKVSQATYDKLKTELSIDKFDIVK